MKKSLKKILYAFLIIPVLFVFTACKDSKTKDEITGIRVSNVKVVFDIGEEFGVGSVKAEKQINNKDWSEISSDVYTIDSTAYNKDEAGVYTIKVTALEKEYSYSVVVLETDNLTVKYNTAYEDIDLGVEGLTIDVADATQTVGAVGTHNINLSYKATPDAETSVSISAKLTVIKADVDYVNDLSALIGTYGQTLESVYLPEGYAWKNPTTALDEVGYVEFKCSYTPVDSTSYNPVDEIDATVYVQKATPGYGIGGQQGSLNAKLSSVILPEGFAWSEPDTILAQEGDYQYLATFTPEDTEHYNTVTLFINVTVVKHNANILSVAGLDTFGLVLNNLEVGTVDSDNLWLEFNNTAIVDVDKFNEIVAYLNENYVRATTNLTDLTTWTANTCLDTEIMGSGIENIEKVYKAYTSNSSEEYVELYAYKLLDDENIYIYSLELTVIGVNTEKLSEEATHKVFDVVEGVVENQKLKVEITSSIEIPAGQETITYTKNEVYAVHGNTGYYGATIFEETIEVGIYREYFDFDLQTITFVYDGLDITGETEGDIHVKGDISYANYIACYNNAFSATITEIEEARNLKYLTPSYFMPFFDLTQDEPVWLETIDAMKEKLVGLFYVNDKGVEIYAQEISSNYIIASYSSDPNGYYVYPASSISSGDFSDDVAMTITSDFDIEYIDTSSHTVISEEADILEFVTNALAVISPEMFFA